METSITREMERDMGIHKVTGNGIIIIIIRGTVRDLKVGERVRTV